MWNSKSGTKPIYSFEEAADYIYDVRWCPSHPAMFATVDGTGSLDLWNLNEETEIPILKTSVSQKALNRIRWSADGKRILTGDSLGNLFIYDTGDVRSQNASGLNNYRFVCQKLKNGTCLKKQYKRWFR
jgi:dynein intermediate chain